MTLTSWALAALGAGAMGWIGPSVIARLPPSVDAGPDAPSYAAIARVQNLRAWLAIGAIALVTIVSTAVPWYLLLSWVIVCGAGSWLFYIDWRTNLLPTRIIWPLYVVTLAIIIGEALFTGSSRILLGAVVASVGAYAVFWLLWWVAGRWKAGSFGFGDVRFAGLLGLVLGTGAPWAAPVGLYLGILLGGVAGLVLKVRGHQDAFALGPCLLVGAVLGPLVTSR